MAHREYRPMWEIREATDEEIALYIYGDVEGDWYDWWNGEVIESETSAEHFRKALAEHPNARRIDIYINSYGGSVFEGTAIYNQLRRHPAEKIVYIDGFACSIASVIAMAGDRVIMPKNTLMMIHNMWMRAVGNARELRKAADDLDVINAAGRQAYLEKAGEKLTEERLAEMMDAETWLTAAECIELGLADEYAEEDVDMSSGPAAAQKVRAAMEQHIGEIRAAAAMLREIRAGMEKGEEPKEAGQRIDPPAQTAVRAPAQAGPADPREEPEPERDPEPEDPEEKTGKTPETAGGHIKKVLAAMTAGR